MFSVEDIAKAAGEHRFLREIANAIQKRGACEIKIEDGCLSIVEVSRQRRYKAEKIEKS